MGQAAWNRPGEGSVEKGLVSEAFATDAIVVQSAGRLIVTRPRPDDHGVDRLLTRAEDGRSLSLQVKAAFALGKYGIVEFAFDKKDVPTRHASYFGLCLPFVGDPLQPPERFWLVPAREILRGGGRRGVNKLRIPYEPKRKGRWTPYLHPFSELARVLEESIDAAAVRGRRP